MDDYVRYLIIVGAIVVITLILFYIMFSYSKASNTWPPEEMPCPDYWKASYENSNSGVACRDIYHLTSRDDNNKSITYVTGTSNDSSLNLWYLDGPATGVDGSGGLGFVRGDLTDISYAADSNLWQTHCGKKIWAQHNGVSWDGITNSNIQCTELGFLENPDDIYAN